MFTHTLRKSGDRHVLASIERVSALMRDVKERPPRLLHMNVEMENVLVNDDLQIVGWLDWDQAALGDPRWDVAGLVNSLHGGYQLPDLAEWAVADYGRETVRPIKDIRLWAALIAVLRWAQCSWLADQVRRRRKVSFPASARFLEGYSSHRAWATQLLIEAERNA
jgi:aminoglycoside phosphotransferase (APT) family kinase protein